MMLIAQAVEAPRINNQWMPDLISYERFGMSADVVTASKASPSIRKRGCVTEQPIH